MALGMWTDDPTVCSGSGKTGILPPGFENVVPAYRFRTCAADEHVDENGKVLKFRVVPGTDTLPNHPANPRRFSFIAKWDDFCDVGRHKISKGQRVRYRGPKALVCMAH